VKVTTTDRRSLTKPACPTKQVQLAILTRRWVADIRHVQCSWMSNVTWYY